MVVSVQNFDHLNADICIWSDEKHFLLHPDGANCFVIEAIPSLVVDFQVTIQPFNMTYQQNWTLISWFLSLKNTKLMNEIWITVMVETVRKNTTVDYHQMVNNDHLWVL